MFILDIILEYNLFMRLTNCAWFLFALFTVFCFLHFFLFS